MKKHIIPVLVVATLAGGALAGGYLGANELWHSAYADGVADAGPVAAPSADPPAAAVPDPVDDPVATGSAVYKLWKDGALVPAVILAAWGLLVLLKAKFPRLSKGRTAIYWTAAITALALLVERASAGTTPNTAMLVGAALAFATFIVKAEFKDAA